MNLFDDRERLIEIFRKMTSGGECIPLEDVIDYLISHGVTVQKHGRWIYEDETLNTSSGYRCTACRSPLWLSPDVPQAFIYCPNCGAKMDGKKNG